MTKKLAGHGSGTALWVTSVGNEYSQVLQCVVTSSESEAGLHEMVTGLMKRYADASVEPPKLLYVDSKCCSFGGTSPFNSLFKEWPQLLVRLDIYHFMRRIAQCVTALSNNMQSYS
jgi:hypothetical protein